LPEKAEGFTKRSSAAEHASAEFTPAKAGVALQTAPLNVCTDTPRSSVLARLASNRF
jgi:hypothetical protein